MFFLTRARAMDSRDEWSREFDRNIKLVSHLTAVGCGRVLAKLQSFG